MNYKTTSDQKFSMIASNFSHAISNLVTQRTLPCVQECLNLPSCSKFFLGNEVGEKNKTSK